MFFSLPVESYLHISQYRDHPAPTKTLGLCILPPVSLDDSTLAFTENILLHSFFGVKNFLLYDRGLTNKFLDTITEAREKDGLLSIRLLPWNPPGGKLDDEVTEYLVAADCAQRTKSEFESVAVLKMSQILVPKAARTVGDVLKGQAWAWGPLQVDVLKFCSEFPANPRAGANEYSLRALEQTTYDEEATLSAGGLRLMHRDAANHNRDGPDTVPRATMAIHDYDQCKKFDFDEKSTKEELFVFNRVQLIEDKIGKYFPHKAV